MTYDELQAYLGGGLCSTHPSISDPPYYKRLAPKLTCKDGFSVSVQASNTHYCTPRNDFGPYSEVELGFPSKAEQTWLPFAKLEDAPKDTVYCYVPVELVLEVINKHGGPK